MFTIIFYLIINLYGTFVRLYVLDFHMSYVYLLCTVQRALLSKLKKMT